MPTLTWVGKDKVVNHHLDVPFRVLQREKRFDAPDGTPANSTDNRIIHGDNLAALKSLLPEFEGKINCIYIDPPYNTGNESWVYNDAVNDPKIKKWLGQVVGKEGEDLSRHDKWLCMMYPRLKLLHRLLAKDGVIFISIDENEICNLRLLMNEIFGENNFIEHLVWNKRVPKNDKFIGNVHEYILVFVKQKNLEHRFIQRKEGIPEINELLASLKRKKVLIPEAEIEIKKLYKKNNYDRGITLYNSLDEDYRLWGKINVSWPNGQTFGQRYDVLHPKTNKPCKVPERGWRWTKETFDSLLDYENIKELHDGSFVCGKIWFAKDENTQPSSIKYLEEVSDFLLRSIISTKSEGAVSLRELINESFDYPKPLELIEILLSSININEGIILDSFAGSGTTAHAVLKLNAQDQGNRRFILIEMEDYADTITAERVRRVMSGYGEGNKQSAGLGGGFDYYSVGAAIFNPDDTLNEAVGVAVIRDYVSYSEGIASEHRTPQNKHETLTASPPKDSQSCSFTPYLLGLSPETAWIFYYELDEVTCLDLDFLGTLKFGANKPATAIIYADKCLLNKEFMTKHGIIFKKIPRDISRF